MSSTKPNAVPTPESVHDVWLRQRQELEQDLFDGWRPAHRAGTEITHTAVASAQPVRPASAPPPVARIEPPAAAPSSREQIPPAQPLEPEQARQAEWLQRANEAALRQRIEHQRLVEQSLAAQREAFLRDLSRLRAEFEKELAEREAAWVAQRDQEYAALASAKDVQERTQRRLQDELAEQRVHEREELMQWRQQAEAELAEARRLFEQDRLHQQQEFARQRHTEMTQLHREREDFDARVRQTQAELAVARKRHEDDLRHTQETQAAQLRAERAELDKVRETWLEKFRREQVVLENGLQFFGQHLSRVSEELRIAQRGLQAVTESAAEARPTGPLTTSALPVADEETPEPAVLSLQEIHERLTRLRQPQRQTA